MAKKENYLVPIDFSVGRVAERTLRYASCPVVIVK